MFDVVLLVGGGAFVAWSLYELVTTTLSLTGAQGPATRLQARMLWWFLGRRRDGRVFRVLRSLSGAIVVLCAIFVWLVLAVVGWGAIFSMEGAIEARSEDAPTHVLDPFFHAAGQLFGQAGPDIRVGDPAWKFAEQLMALNGVALLSLSLAWVIPVVGAVVSKRHLAARIHLLGDTPSDVLLRNWDGSDFGDLNLHLNAIADDLSQLAHKQYAYPAVHYFSASDPKASLSVGLAMLTEATFVLAEADIDDRATGPSVLNHYWRAVETYLERMTSTFAHIADSPPPSCEPRLDPDDRLGIDAELELDAVLRDHERLRRLLAGAVAHDGWDWESVVLGQPDTPHDSGEPARSQR